MDWEIKAPKGRTSDKQDDTSEFRHTSGLPVKEDGHGCDEWVRLDHVASDIISRLAAKIGRAA